TIGSSLMTCPARQVKRNAPTSSGLACGASPGSSHAFASKLSAMSASPPRPAATTVVVTGGGGVEAAGIVTVVLALDVAATAAAAALPLELQLVAKSRLKISAAPKAHRSFALIINYPPRN